MPIKRLHSTMNRNNGKNGKESEHDCDEKAMTQPQQQQLMMVPTTNRRDIRFHRSENDTLNSEHVLDYLKRATSGSFQSMSSADSTVLLTELSCEDVISDKTIEEMANLFQKNHQHVNLTVLRLQRNHLTAAAASPLANILQFTEKLMVLDIRSNKLGPDGVQTLVKPLIERGEGCSLISLNLADNSLGPKAATSIAQLLRLNKTIKDLDLGNNQFRSKGMKAIAKGLEENNTIRTLILPHNQGSTGIPHILKSIQENWDSHIESLDISANKVGGTGAGIKALRELLLRNKTLHDLDLSANSLKTIGALEFAPALKLPNILLDLNLGQNEIGNEGVIAIANSLIEDGMEHGHCYLARLSLDYSLMTDEGAIYLARSLERNTKLMHLNLSHNHIGSQGATQFARTFAINFTLREVLFHDNNMDDEAATAMAQALGRKNCKIDMFTWYNNSRLSPKGEFALSHVFDYRESLRTWLADMEEDLKEDRAMSINWWTLPRVKTITDLEVAFLAQCLGKHNPERLQSIYLAGQHVTDRSIVELCENYLSENPSLQRFYVKDITIGSYGMEAIGQALCMNRTLRVLSVTNCGLTARTGAGVLVVPLKNNSTLQRLNLQGNDIGDDGFLFLWEVIRKPHPSIISLNVSNNNLSDKSMAILHGSIAKIQELYLDGNPISDRGALDLAKAIMDRDNLKILSVGSNTVMTHRGKNTLRSFAPNRFSA